MSNLPPLANVFAFADPDPKAVAEMHQRLASDPRVDEVREPAAGWVAAITWLPGRKAPAHLSPFVFAQGADLAPQIVEHRGGRFAELDGDFGFLHLQTGGRGTVVRACGGPVPFYLFSSGQRRAVATQIGDFLRYLPEPPVADPLVHAIRTCGYGTDPDNRSFLAGVSVLPRGHAATFDTSGPPRIQRYWDPRPETLDPPANLPQQAAELRERLLGVLQRELEPDGANLLTLSGGTDSSALAGLIRGVLGFPLSSLSFVVDHEPAWQEAFPAVARVVRHWDLEPAWIAPLSTASRLELMAAAPVVGRPVPHPALGALPGIVAQSDIRVLVGGELADEVCGSRLTFADWVNETSALTLLRTPASQLPFGPQDRLLWLRKRVKLALRQPELPYVLELPDLFTAELREEYREWRHRQERLALADRRPRRTFARQLEQDGWIAMNWEACSALGVRRSMPFMTREVLELAYRCHPRALIGPGTKRLLRAAVAEDVPPDHLDRGKGGPSVPESPLPTSWTPPDLGELENLINHNVLASHRLTAPEGLALQQLATTAAAMDVLRHGRSSALTGGTAG